MWFGYKSHLTDYYFQRKRVERHNKSIQRGAESFFSQVLTISHSFFSLSSLLTVKAVEQKVNTNKNSIPHISFSSPDEQRRGRVKYFRSFPPFTCVLSCVVDGIVHRNSSYFRSTFQYCVERLIHRTRATHHLHSMIYS